MTKARQRSRIVGFLLLFVVLLSRTEAQRPRPEELRPEFRPAERVRMVERDPSRWAELERSLNRETLEKTWERLGTRERIRVSEFLGERTMEREATRLGFGRVCSVGAASERLQGFDAVYRHGDRIIVGEAKGSAARCSVESLLGNGYGFRQGSLEWAHAAAEAVLKSSRTNAREKRAASEVLEAEKTGRLAVLVFVTYHQRGIVAERAVVQTAGSPL